jgi:lipid A 3-O-deacylase
VKTKHILAGISLACVMAPASQALEIRAGVQAHDLAVANEGSGGKEDGVNLNIEASFEGPELLRVIARPRPYVMASINSSGDTSFAAAGLAWRGTLKSGIYGEVGVGYAVHDGIVSLPSNPADPRRIELDRTRAILGSRDLFRSHLTIGYNLNERWSAGVMFEHLSHGQILGSGRNEGLDTLGVRIGYRFGNR